MYKTKKEVDAHVRNALSKLRSETERHLRSFTIAKLYYKINEYSSAEQYLNSYLSVKEDNDQAHKLLGQCYQRLKKPDKALQSFQRTLQLNSKQPDILAEVCQLLLEETNFNANKAKYWCELAESEKVQNDAVFMLRLKLMNKDHTETSKVEELIQREISARPRDVQLRVRLVRNYIEQNKVLDAFKYVHTLEMSHNDAFASSTEWYNVVWLVLSKYELLPNTKKDWEFWLLLANCLERQVYISFGTSSGGVTETANLLFNLDQYLHKISQVADQLSAQKELVALFLDHYRGQLLLHAASLIFKRELLQNKNKWKETVQAVLPLLLLAYQVESIGDREPWMKHCDEQGKQLVQLWNREGAFRCAQVGRTLLSCISNDSSENGELQVNRMIGNQPTLWTSSDELLAQIRRTCAEKQWRRSVFALLFCNSDQKVKEQSSLLMRCAKLNEPTFELPTYADVERHEEAAQFLKPQSLQHMVYLCLANDNLAYVRARYFSGLNFSTPNLAFCGSESLNQLDVETFLYAATMQAKRTLEVERDAFDNYNSGNRSAAGKPRLLPFVNLQGHLCTEEQAAWWSAAYRVYKNLSSENVAELRACLQFGIEAVRGVNGPKIDMLLVFRLGRLFVARAQDVVKPVEKALLEARAECIYKYGLNMLKMHNKGVLEPFRKYFKYANSNTAAVEREVTAAAEDAVSYLAARFFKKAEYEELIEELSGVQLPFATYMQAEAYRKLDEINKTPQKVKRMYLDRAGECLNQTLALLKSTQTDPDHPLNSVIHAELKRLQQASTKFLNRSNSRYSPAGGAHNNSSTYEDAEEDAFFVSDSPGMLPTGGGNLHRSRHDSANASAAIAAAVAANAAASARSSSDLEALVKQMATTLCFVKEEIVDGIKPQVLSMHKEITALKEKIHQLEDGMKKTRISANTPSREDVLDDLYLIEDALQNQMYSNQQSVPTSQPHMPSAGGNMFSSTMCGTGGVHSPFTPHHQQQQQRIHTPNALQMQQNAAAAAAVAAYNSPIFNPNYPMNYYTQPSYMMAAQQSAGVGVGTNSMLGQRNPLTMPYMDTTGGMNYNMAQTTPLLPPPSGQDGRTNSNLYGLLSQPQQQQAPQLPQLTMPPLAPLSQMQPPTMASSALAPAPAAAAAPTGPTPTSVAQFNKALNNQPVEKGPPANVVITSSDPLPNPNSTALNSQQPPLSVTIPSHHIKPSLVQTPEAVGTTTATGPSFGTGMFGGFGLNGNAPGSGTASAFGGFGLSGNTTGASTITSLSTSSMFNSKTVTSVASSNTPTVAMTSSTISSTTFTFKPQVLQAAQQSKAELASEALNKTTESVGSDHNKSAGAGSTTDPEIEYDPRPDFKPIIPLPDEIEVKTGEEDEEVMFGYRAKLFRMVDKEWKERGIGDIKILKNKFDGSSRILMRRDQTHKICANHKITKELVMTEPKNESKGCIWVANDFADEELRTEKFFVRFKLLETVQQFHEAFKQAQKEAAQLEEKQQTAGGELQPPATTAVPSFGLSKSAATNFATSTPAPKSEGVSSKQPAAVAAVPNGPKAASNATTTSTPNTAVSKSLFGGVNLSGSKTEPEKQPDAWTSPFAKFSFDKTATATAATTTPTSTASPFANILANLSKPTVQSPFGSAGLSTPTTAANTSSATSGVVESNKTNVSDTEEEYVPTAQFTPVIPLPDLVEMSTGEENEIVLFEHRAKLLRFNKEAGEWKERGLGNIKLLQDAQDVNKVRLVMRREQIHKLCCNQNIYKETTFKYLKNSKTALTWGGIDYSENELSTEMLTVRFKTPETCQQFHEAVLRAQANMSSNVTEDNAKLLAAEEKKVKEVTVKTEASEAPKGFGNAFKPKAGSWSCEACYITNNADTLHCVACDTPKDDTVPKKEPVSVLTSTTKSTFSFGFGAGANTAATAAPASSAFASAKSPFTFGMPTTAATTVAGSPAPAPAPAPQPPVKTSTVVAPATSTSTTMTKGFGEQFKPKAGSWTCDACYVSNTGDTLYCTACDSPKDATVPKKEVTSTVGLNLSKSAPKFSFGFAAAGAAEKGSGDGVKSSTTDFAFGAPAATQSDPPKTLFGALASVGSGDGSKSFTFTPPSATSTTLAPAAAATNLSKPTFSFSLQSKAMEAPALSAATAGGGEATSASPFSLDKKDFSFTLKPKSPGKLGKSPLKAGGVVGEGDDADADADYDEEEENNTYFTPVIPLPDKIDVKTGEEDEELLYVHRAKLYRYIDGEWKERGLGDVKILRHKETKGLRVVMRREQVLKICLNHVLNDAVEYKSKDDKSWLFVVNDFSEGALSLEKLSLRFKSKEIAMDFMDAVRSALAGTAAAIEPPTLATNGDSSEAVKATANISESDRKQADQLQLPYEFYGAKPTCAGCRGCDPDKVEFPAISTKETFVQPEDSINPPLPLELPALTMPPASRPSLLKQPTLAVVKPLGEATNKQNESIFSGFSGAANSTAFGGFGTGSEKPANTTFSFAAALNSTANKPEEAKLLSGGFLFGSGGGSLFSGGDKKPIFGQSSALSDAAKTDSKPAVESTNNLFSGKSIFTGKSVFGETPSIFGGLAPKADTSANDTTKSIFGNSTSSTLSGGNGTGNSIFGTSTTFAGFANNSTMQTSIFGGAAGDKTTSTATTPSTVTGTTSNTTSTATTTGSFVFGGAQKDATPAAVATNIFADLSSKTGGIDFASLAAKANSVAATKPAEKPGPGGFIGLTNNDAFSNFNKANNNNSLKTSNDKNANESSRSVGDDPADNTNDDNYDPYYEPIIALPSEITLSTGEEKETKLFGERAVLFRYDPVNKEWKERGVGELKILMHPEHNTYRLVMRREQIHKLVLNHAVGKGFIFKNMTNFPKAFTWATLNFAESTEGVLETLSVRFKNVDLAQKFSKELTACIEAANKHTE